MAGQRSPWGKPKGADGGGGEPPRAEGAGPPRNPWLPPGGGGTQPGRRPASIEDLFKNRGPEGPRRIGGGGGGTGGPGFRLPRRADGKSWVPVLLMSAGALWIILSSVHQVQPKEQGIVTTFGQYTRTLQPGINVTLPWPLQNVSVVDVSTFRSERVPGTEAEKLILTGDQNLVDLSYLIRWNIKDLRQFRFQLAEPEETVREVAEAAMRASVAEHELDYVLSGAGRADIEQRVRTRMQELLDAYRSGVAVQGIEIEKTDPPERVVEAFKDVSAAQQDAETDINRARAYAQQLLARAEGDATAFNKIYEEYRLAPEVTRRRLYYETMESVLARTDKTVVEAPGVQTYLPLPEVQRRAREAQQQAQQAPRPAQPAAPAGAGR
ncbi:protease modulator HflK [Erythrobacteraceae bacterium CFH 75059]|nr:protease modulator HflK [Erythrobacteraceae bacterium CFH 75059]